MTKERQAIGEAYILRFLHSLEISKVMFFSIVCEVDNPSQSLIDSRDSSYPPTKQSKPANKD